MVSIGTPTRVGIVVIGRDLGARLERCLRSVTSAGHPVVYVDSASQDDSLQLAASLHVCSVKLDAAARLSAARGRNEGAAFLLRTHPETFFLQFIDGDCELDPTWLAAGLDAMRAEARLAIVCGHVREKHANTSVAAMLLDTDWRGPVGDIKACGGIFLARRDAFEEVGGFSADLITGEEAELCRRLLDRGWKVRRIDRPMCAHDADIHSIGKWLKRAVRTGRTYAMSAALEGVSHDPGALGRILRTLFWSLFLPLIAVASLIAALWHPTLLLVGVGVALLYALQITRLSLRMRRAGLARRNACLYATFTMLAKWAQMWGILRHWSGR